MYFKGDIIITDPCYVMKDEKDYKDFSSEPQLEAFVSVFPVLEDFFNNKELMEQYSKDYEKYHNARQAWEKENPDHWKLCDYGFNMEALGFTTYLTSDTEYGDWSCTTYEEETKKELGGFCADAGLVSVFLLEEVLKYDPKFDYHLNRPWTTTLIKDFEGDIEITHFEDEEETVKRPEKEVSVIGKGNVNFFTTQTGL